MEHQSQGQHILPCKIQKKIIFNFMKQTSKKIWPSPLNLLLMSWLEGGTGISANPREKIAMYGLLAASGNNNHGICTFPCQNLD